MSANVELKARCPDPEALRRRVVSIATERVGLDEQVDTYFRVPEGRLKLRESSLSGGQLIPYRRPDREETRRSDYRVIPIPDPAGTRDMLAGILGVHRVVRKRREIFRYENVRIHLDRVEGLGAVLEFEAVFDGTPESEREQHRKLRFLADKLGVRDGDRVASSYEALLGGSPR